MTSTRTGRAERSLVGGGYIGLEIAEALTQRGLSVTIVEMAEYPLASLDPDMGALVADAIRQVGIELATCHRVEGFEVGSDGRVTAVTTDATDATGRLPAELVVLGLGVRPDTRLAEDAGTKTGQAGGIVVDRRGRTRTDGVWAAGDCTEKFHRVRREPVAVALGTHANKQGRVAGINLGGGYATFPGIVGTAATRICAHEVARTGLTEAEATAAGFSPVTETVRSTTRAGYYPGAAPPDRQGRRRTAQRAAVGCTDRRRGGCRQTHRCVRDCAVADMTVEELLNVDLSYAPPVAPLWDPVLIAARKAWQRVEADAA